MISLPAMSNLLVRCGKANPSYTGQMWVTPSPESTTTPVKRPGIGKEKSKIFCVSLEKHKSQAGRSQS